MVRWIRVCISTAEGMGLIPGWGTKILHAVWHSQKKKKKTKTIIIIKLKLNYKKMTEGVKEK